MEQLIEKCRTLGISFSLSADDQLELHAKTQPSAALIDEIKAEKQNLISLIKRNKLKQLIQQLAQLSRQTMLLNKRRCRFSNSVCGWQTPCAKALLSIILLKYLRSKAR